MGTRQRGRNGTERAEDERRFAAVYPAVRRFASAVGPPGVDPDDLVQEALARALRRGSLADVENLVGYLQTTVLNLARNHRRSWVRAVRAVDRIGGNGHSIDVYPSDLADLMRLPPETRAVLYLVEVEGCSFAEVGSVLGLTTEAARARASRARHALRDAIGPEMNTFLEA